jgi:hypothetical protein
VSIVTENVPLMVLAEDSADRVVYRFRGKRWGVFTLILGITLVGVGFTTIVHRGDVRVVSLALVFGVLMLLSTLYSFTAEQWLQVDGSQRAIRFHKKNLYGRADWERPGSDFAEIRVFRPSARGGPAANWSILLVDRNGAQLSLGENEFGSFHRERALELAGKLGRLAGIAVVES